MLGRRAFLRSLLALPIAATFDVEKLLWVPGQMVVVPSAAQTFRLTLSEIDAVALRCYVPVIEEFFKASPLLALLKERTNIHFDGKTIEMPIVYREVGNDAGPLASVWHQRFDIEDAG